MCFIGIDWYAQSNQDLYTRLEEDGWPRDVVKKAFNIMMNAPSRSSAIGSLKDQQRKTGFLFNDGMMDFKGWSSHLVRSIENAYPEMADVFYAELGNHFMNKEGNICMAVAEWAVRERMPILTLHDSFVVLRRDRQAINENIILHFRHQFDARCKLETINAEGKFES